MARHRNRRLRRIARQTAELQVAPERRQLNSALGDAAAARDQGVAAARTTGRGLQAAIRAARPGFRSVYNTAGRQLEANRGLVNANMPGASSGPAAAILAAAAAEQQAAENANTAAKRATMVDLRKQGVRAQEGVSFAVQNAQRQYQSDVGKILQELLGLSQDEGKYAAAEFGRLRENALDRDLRRASQRESHRHNQATEGAANARLRETQRHNRQTEKNGGKGSGGAGGWKAASQEAHLKASSSIGEALAAIKQLDDGKGPEGRRRQDIGDLLLSGTPAQKDANGNTVPGLPKIPRLFLRAALDQHFKGHLSKQVSRKLHANRYAIRRLDGVIAYWDWAKTRPPTGPRERQHVQPGGGRAIGR